MGMYRARVSQGPVRRGGGIRRSAVLEQPILVPRVAGTGGRHRVLRTGVRPIPAGRHGVFQGGGPTALGDPGGAHSAARTW